MTAELHQAGSGPRQRGPAKKLLAEARNLAVHVLVVQKVSANPALLDKVRQNLGFWRTSAELTPRWVTEWEHILLKPWTEIAALLTDPGERACRLRRFSPFTGILSREEGKEIFSRLGKNTEKT